MVLGLEAPAAAAAITAVGFDGAAATTAVVSTARLTATTGRSVLAVGAPPPNPWGSEGAFAAVAPAAIASRGFARGGGLPVATALALDNVAGAAGSRDGAGRTTSANAELPVAGCSIAGGGGDAVITAAP